MNYITNVLQLLAVVFIIHCVITLHVSGALCTHHQEYDDCLKLHHVGYSINRVMMHGTTNIKYKILAHLLVETYPTGWHYSNYMWQYRHTCWLKYTSLDAIIVGHSCYIFELNRSINSKWAIFGLCHRGTQWAVWLITLCRSGAGIAQSVWWIGYLLDDRGIGVRFPVAEIFLLSTAPNTTESPWRHVYWLVDIELRLRTVNCNTGPFLLLHFAYHQHLTTL